MSKVILRMDSRRRITLPWFTGVKPGDTLKMSVLPNGQTELIPVEMVEKRWISPATQVDTGKACRIIEEPPC